MAVTFQPSVATEGSRPSKNRGMLYGTGGRAFTCRSHQASDAGPGESSCAFFQVNRGGRAGWEAPDGCSVR